MEKALKEWQDLHKFHMYNNYLTKELAEYIGVSTRTIQRWIKGKNNPSEEKMHKIEEFLISKGSNQKSTT